MSTRVSSRFESSAIASMVWTTTLKRTDQERRKSRFGKRRWRRLRRVTDHINGGRAFEGLVSGETS